MGSGMLKVFHCQLGLLERFPCDHSIAVTGRLRAAPQLRGFSWPPARAALIQVRRGGSKLLDEGCPSSLE